MINHLKLRDTLNAYDYTIGEFMVMVGKAQSYLGSVYMFKSDETDLCQKIIDSDSLAEADITWENSTVPNSSWKESMPSIGSANGQKTGLCS